MWIKCLAEGQKYWVTVGFEPGLSAWKLSGHTTIPWHLHSYGGSTWRLLEGRHKISKGVFFFAICHEPVAQIRSGSQGGHTGFFLSVRCQPQVSQVRKKLMSKKAKKKQRSLRNAGEHVKRVLISINNHPTPRSRGDIWYYVPHIQNCGGTCPPAPPPPPGFAPMPWTHLTATRYIPLHFTKIAYHNRMALNMY